MKRPPRSMQRLIVGYIPANVVPAVVSVGSISIFTRLLSEHEFGLYNLAFSVMMFAQSVLFFAPNLALTRFYPKAESAGTVSAFLKTMYAVVLCLAAAAVVAAAAGFGGAALFEQGRSGEQLGPTIILVVPVLLLRALVATNQTFNLAAGHMARFNAIECLHALVGLAAGVGLVVAGAHTGVSIMVGLLIGAAACALLDLRPLLSLRSVARIDREVLGEVLRFCWPLVLAFVVMSSLQYADRFLVGTYDGAAALGLYAVAYSLTDRPITLISLAVTAGTFPLSVQAYVNEGPEAGRRQAGKNGAVLLGLAAPGCVWLAFNSHPIAEALVGPSFRDGVAMLIPIMAATALLRNFGAHYVDHAFHLANRSFRLFLFYAPAAAANVVLSAVLVPSFGMAAAAYGALACQALALLGGWIAARAVLPLWLPRREIAKIGLCLALMSVGLAATPMPLGWLGLLCSAPLSLALYGGGALAVDLGGVRGMLARLWGARSWAGRPRAGFRADPNPGQPSLEPRCPT